MMSNTITNFYRTGEIDLQKQQQKSKNKQFAIKAKSERLSIVLKALFKAKKYENFKSTIMAIKQYDSFSKQTTLMKQYLNHCATIIQSRFKGYQNRKYYRNFLPIYRRFKQLLNGVVLGWKVRRIIKLPSFKKRIAQIHRNQRQGKLMNMRILKRQFSSDIQKFVKFGLWINQYKKNHPQKKLNKQYVQKSIKNFFTKTVKFSQTNQPKYKNFGKQKNNQLQKTKRINKNEVKQNSNIVINNNYVHHFDQIPVKKKINQQTGRIDDFQRQIEEELKKQQIKVINKKPIKKKMIENKQKQQEQPIHKIQKQVEQKNYEKQKSLSLLVSNSVNNPKKKMKLSLVSKSIKDSTLQHQMIESVSIKIPTQIKNIPIQENSKIVDSPSATNKKTQSKKMNRKTEIHIHVRPFQKQQLKNEEVMTAKIQSNKYVQIKQLLNVYNTTYENKKRQIDLKFQAMKKDKLSRINGNQK